MKKVLFIDRDGTLVLEPEDNQLDHLNKLKFEKGVFYNLARIAREMNYELVMVTNQDGLGTASFPEAAFWPVQNFIEETFRNEGVVFKEIIIDRTFANENSTTRKPRTGLLTHYLDEPDYDMANSFVIGDRLTDMEFARNLGAQGILISGNKELGRDEISIQASELEEVIELRTKSWADVHSFLTEQNRIAEVKRKTKETDVFIRLHLGGTGKSDIETGLAFFDHMLDQVARHGQIDLEIKVSGDLEVDEHHTIEDTAIALGEAVAKALGDKRGIERYGFCLPMDDSLAQVALDFGGRNWLVWNAEFKREKIGQMPTEMFYHFFKSFTDGAKANLNIKAEGSNEHHKIEAVFKSFARALKAAIKQDPEKMVLPTTKGIL